MQVSLLAFFLVCMDLDSLVGKKADILPDIAFPVAKT